MSNRRIAGVAAALALVAVVALFTLRSRPPPPPAPGAVTRESPAPRVVAASRAPEVVAERPETRPEVEDMPAPPPWIELDEHGVPIQDITIHALGPGDGTGVHAFPLPGTKPIKRGILVPEGYVLPPGYLRHFQTTDDGEEVPPILVFDPVHPPLDAAGNPIAVPPGNPVVPPELAPPGMPVKLLDPPPVRADLDEHARPLR